MMQPPPPPPPPRQSQPSPPIETLPFGYDISSGPGSQLFPPLPPGSAAGSLLDNFESRGLDSFIETVGSPGYNDASFFDRAMASAEWGDFSLAEDGDLPPQFFGATSSLPQSQTAQDTGEPLLENSRAQGSQPLQSSSLHYHQSMSGEDMNAVSALMQGSRAPSSSIRQAGPRPQLAHLPQQHSSAYPSPLNSGLSMPLERSSVISAFGYEHETRPSDSSHSGAVQYFPNSSHPPSYDPPSRESSRTGVPPNLHWGSDQGFYHGSYVAPPHHETEQEVTQGLMHKMECFVPQTSANTTRPPSPRVAQEDINQSHQRAIMPKPADQDDQDMDELPVQEKKPAPGSKRPRQPRKQVNDRDEGETLDKKPEKPKKKRGRPVSKGKDQNVQVEPNSPEAPPSRRRKSLGFDFKPGRENLTEGQKKANHIVSEQKRRNLIKQGFDDLRGLVPTLKGSGTSRSVILTHAADWLEDFLKGNAELKVILASLQGEHEGEASEGEQQRNNSEDGDEASDEEEDENDNIQEYKQEDLDEEDDRGGEDLEESGESETSSQDQ